MKIITKGSLIRLGLLFIILLPIGGCMISMPGKSYLGELPPLTDQEVALREALRSDVEHIAGTIGQRNIWHYEALLATADFVETGLKETGYKVERQAYEVDGKTCYNLVAELAGTDAAHEIIVLGAHYDSIIDCPAANDNGSGVAALLALARAFKDEHQARTLRFVAFVNEEPPFFQTESMGSYVYAKRCREAGDQIVGMFSLETIGFYSEDEDSQSYPFPFSLFYPSTGNFIGFVSTTSSRQFVRRAVKSFRENARFPSEGVAVPGTVPGVTWSDHWSFIKMGYPAVMVTDTAPFRYAHYHTPEDTPDKLSYDDFARVVSGLERVVADLAARESRY